MHAAFSGASRPATAEEEGDERKAQRAQRFKADLGSSTPPVPLPLRRPTPQQARPPVDDAMGDDDDQGANDYVVGTCEDMCPAAERTRRMRQRDVAYFERPNQAEPDVTTRELAVKKFARKVTVKQRDEDVDDSDMWGPSDVRTMAALERTMVHLRGLMDRSDVPFGVLHKFLWDRHRSVRQDLNVQHIKVWLWECVGGWWLWLLYNCVALVASCLAVCCLVCCLVCCAMAPTNALHACL